MNRVWSKRIAVAALMLTTSITPAEAAPVTAFVGGFLNALGAGTWLASGAVGAWTAGFTFGSTAFGAFVGRAVAYVGLNAISAALRGRPRPPAPSQRMVNFAQPLAYMQRIYGDCRLGGPFSISAMKDGVLHYGVIVAAHSTVGPQVHYLGRREVEIDGSGNVITAPMDGVVKIRAYSGQIGQAADPVHLAAFSEVTSAHDFEGISWAALEAARVSESRFQEVYPSGREPEYAPVWRGDDQVYDPRISARGYSNNAALVFAREAEFHGKEVDMAELAEEAAACDVLVPNGDGGVQPRWTLNRVFGDDQPWGETSIELARAFDAWMYERPDGKVGFKAGRWIAPTVTLTDADFFSIVISEEDHGPDAPGEFVVNYTEPARDWVEAPSGALVVSEGKRDVQDAFAAGSHNQAIRVARANKRRARPQYRVSGQVGLIGFELIGQRFVAVSALGRSMVIEVDQLDREADGRTFTLRGFSVTEADFADDDASYEPARPTYAEVASEDAVPEVAGLTAEVVEGSGGVAQIALDWTAPGASLTPVIRLRQAGGDWQEIETSSGASSWLLTGLADGAVYDFQIRNRTATRRVSDWAPATPIPVTAVANTTPPAALAAFSVSVLGGDAEVAFTAPNDAVYSATRIYRGPTTDFADASAVRVEAGAPNLADTWTDAGLAAGTYSYWAEPLNASGVAGTRSGPETITII